MASIVGVRVVRFSFWQKLAIGICAFIVFGFAQFGLRGMIDYRQAPLVMHVHGMVMLSWLVLVVTQSLLVGRGGMAVHRRLGWASVVLLPTIAVLAIATCVTALRAGMFPPFFTAPYFLALNIVGMAAFVPLVATAIVLRANGDWHRRLMVGSTVLLMEPALGRVLPMPLIVPWGEWLSMVVQLGVVAIVARHDHREPHDEGGRIHPATLVVGLAIVLSHVAVELLAISPWWIARTAGIVGT